MRAEIAQLIAAGVRPEEIKVVAAFNAQVQRLRAVMPAGVEVGTVDKLEGQEALGLCSPHGLLQRRGHPPWFALLLSRNRLNVAVSRAQALAYLVCSPRKLVQGRLHPDPAHAPGERA